jgi:heme A synthase
MGVKSKAFQGLAFVTVAALYVLVVLGGFVSSTGSGLACPDWPLCQGQVIPAFTFNVLIEFTHRAWTIVATLFVVATAIYAWRKYPVSSRVAEFASLTFVLLLAQITLGMVTVETRTLPIVVTAHLATATLVFASSLTTAMFSLFYDVKEAQMK